ncbi:MAG: RNA polymerase sigma factor [Lysobacterales bacterium]
MLSKTAKLKDWSLMMKVGQGCNASFNMLFAEYHPRLLRFLGPRLQDPHTVEAVASDTLMTARDKANQFLATGQLSTWLFGIAVRKAMRVGDREGRRRGALPEVTYNESVNGTNQESRIRELGDLIRAGITRLPVNQKRALVLHLVEGYSLEETAKRLGIPLGTVKTRIFEARKQLKLTLN